MCGIAGYSLSPTSTVNARELGHNLLVEIEQRGQMAAGFAYANEEGNIGWYKDAKRGGQLPLKSLPRTTKTAIFHTRQATHGSIHEQENNHPIISPSGNMALIHNGVIWNEQEVRHDALEGVELPEVDSSVIGAILEKYGLQGVDELSGDAAVAWLVQGEGNTLNLARFESSPVAYTWLMDGSFVFASTVSLLMTALDNMKLDYGYVFTLEERSYWEIQGGVVTDYVYTPKFQSYSWSSYMDSVRSVTSGGKGSEEGTWEEWMGDEEFDEDGFYKGPKSTRSTGFGKVYHDDMDDWEQSNDNPDFADEVERNYISNFNKAMALIDAPTHDEYYTIDSGGDMQTYASLDALEMQLIWYAGLSKGGDAHYNAEGNVRWVEHFIDVGSFEMDGKTPLSWIDQVDDTYNHEDLEHDKNLGYIREGIGLLKQEIGR